MYVVMLLCIYIRLNVCCLAFPYFFFPLDFFTLAFYALVVSARLVEADKKTRGEGFGRGLAGVVD